MKTTKIKLASCLLGASLLVTPATTVFAAESGIVPPTAESSSQSVLPVKTVKIVKVLFESDGAVVEERLSGVPSGRVGDEWQFPTEVEKKTVDGKELIFKLARYTDDEGNDFSCSDQSSNSCTEDKMVRGVFKKADKENEEQGYRVYYELVKEEVNSDNSKGETSTSPKEEDKQSEEQAKPVDETTLHKVTEDSAVPKVAPEVDTPALDPNTLDESGIIEEAVSSNPPTVDLPTLDESKLEMAKEKNKNNKKSMAKTNTASSLGVLLASISGLATTAGIALKRKK